MDLLPLKQNFEKIQNRLIFYHGLKENPIFSKTAKFCGEML